VDHQGDLAGLETERCRGVGVVDLVDVPELREVVPGSERAELRHPALAGPLADARRIGPAERPTFLDHLEVVLPPVPVLHRPPRPVHEHPVELLLGELAMRLRSDAGRDRAVQRRGELAQLGPHVGHLQIGSDQPDAAVDVVAHAARGEHALVGVEGGHAADGEAVAPVDVGHGEGGADDPRELGDVGNLLGGAVLLDGAHHLFGGVDAAFDAHRAFSRDAPAPVVDALEPHTSITTWTRRSAPSRRIWRSW
jgi:hypothetical protein